MKDLADFKKSIIIFSTLLVLCVLGMWGSYEMRQFGEYRSHKETRHARMIDVFDRHGHVKGHDYYHTYGYFVDRETGKHFNDSITEITFNQFKRDGNKGIETSWPYSIDKIEQTSIGDFALMGSFLGFFFCMFFGIFNLSQIILAFSKYREHKEQQFQLNKKSP